MEVDVGIIGGGFTGVSAALHLAKAGAKVALVEAQTPGWGASGRNGGFCCLGGGMLDDVQLTRRFDAEAAREFDRAEQASVALVRDLIESNDIDADVHSNGETLLAHRARDMENLRAKVAGASTPMELIERADLPNHGMDGPFHGALTIPTGFALNPRKYLFGIAKAAQAAGAELYQNAQVTEIKNDTELVTARGRLRCKKVVIATNGYSSDALPKWLAGRYMPSQSNVLVTRQMSQAEI